MRLPFYTHYFPKKLVVLEVSSRKKKTQKPDLSFPFSQSLKLQGCNVGGRTYFRAFLLKKTQTTPVWNFHNLWTFLIVYVSKVHVMFGTKNVRDTPDSKSVCHDSPIIWQWCSFWRRMACLGLHIVTCRPGLRKGRFNGKIRTENESYVRKMNISTIITLFVSSLQLNAMHFKKPWF